MKERSRRDQKNKEQRVGLPAIKLDSSRRAEDSRSASKGSSHPLPRGYHLFQPGSIKLLSGALEADVPRSSGGKSSRHLHVATSSAPKGDSGTTRISMGPSSLLASRATDYHKWVLALRQPPVDDEWVENEATPCTPHGNQRRDNPSQGDEASSANNHFPGDLDPPLEDQITVRELTRIMRAFASETKDFFSKTGHILTDSEKDEEDGGNSSCPPSSHRRALDTGFASSAEDAATDTKKYDRKLTTEEFVTAVQGTIPLATRESILELVNKVDYEGVGVITWNELSTYLVSQSSHRTFLSHANAEFSQIPDPSNCLVDSMHQLVSCYCTCPSKKLLVTGGHEGTVRAWTVTTLAYRGILFSTDSWISGVQFSANARVLYVVTMNREVFLLDGGNFEVLLLYRGRPVEDNSSSLVYVHDTTRTVAVGGIPLLSRKAVERQLVEATKINEKRKQEISHQPTSTTITSASACEALNFSSIPITGEGNGPYVERALEECVLAGLVDPVTCFAYNFSLLEEEVLLLGTSNGEIYFYIIRARSTKKVLLSHYVLRIHSKTVNKLAFMFSMNALVSCADDGKVLVTSMVNGQVIRAFQASSSSHAYHSAVRDFAIHPHYKMICTVGPERHGLVWEFSQESPIAVLDAHNSPCRCCAFSQKNAQVITCGVDGVLHIFDLNGFHLSQKLEPGYTHSPQLLLCDSTGSLLCFRRYPFNLRIKRMKSSESKEKYIGHTASLVSILHSKAFDQIITVDLEFTVMIWKRATGRNIFTFLLNGYSDSTTINASPLTCATLDMAHRRLITGYQNGVVVVWNIVNGQAINFITAGMEESEEQKPSHDTKRSASSVGGPRNKKGLSRAPTGGSGGGILNSSNAYRPVRTVGSLLRDGSTFFIFAIHDTLYIVRESTNYTVATAASWKVPRDFGEITGIIQVTTEVIVCGTSLGAVFFFHLLSQRQDGAVRWIPDPNTALQGSSIMASDGKNYLAKRQPTSASSPPPAGIPQISVANASNPLPMLKVGKQNYSRVTQIFPLFATSPNLFLTAHADGTVAFWHTVRRVYLGSVNLTSATADEGRDRSGSVVVAVDDLHNLLIFGDEGGNIHVCRFHMELLSSEQEVAALGLGNPALYFPISKEEALPSSVPVSNESSLLAGGASTISNAVDQILKEDGAPEPATNHSPLSADTKPAGNATNRYFMERAIYIPKKLERVNVFGTNCRSISSLVVANSPWKCTAKDNSSVVSAPEEKESGGGSGDGEGNPEDQEEGLIIVCNGSDSYSRCFTLKGDPIGELGMNSWVLGDQSSYCHMGEPHLGGPFPTSFTLEKGWYHNYLSDLLYTSKQALNVRKARSKMQHSMSNFNFDIPTRTMSVKVLSMKEDGPPSGYDGLLTASSTHHPLEVEVLSPPIDSLVESPEKELCASEPDGMKLHSSHARPPYPGKVIDTKLHQSLRQFVNQKNLSGNRILKLQFLNGINPGMELQESLPGGRGGSNSNNNLIKRKGVRSSLEADLNGEFENIFVSGMVSKHSKINSLELIQNYSNPMSPSDRLGYGPLDEDVTTKCSPSSSLQSVIKVHRSSMPNAAPAQARSPDSFDSPKTPILNATARSSIHSTVPLQTTRTNAFAKQEEEDLIFSETGAAQQPSQVSSHRNDVSLSHSLAKLLSPHQQPNMPTSCKPEPSPFQSVTSNRFLGRVQSSMDSVAPNNLSIAPSRKDGSAILRQPSKYPVSAQGRSATPVKEAPSRFVEDESRIDPKDLIKQHLSEKRKQIMDSACTEKSRRYIEQEMNKSTDGSVRRDVEEVGKLSDIHQFVQNIVEEHRKARSSAALSGALSFITDVSSRMHVAPIQDIEPPEGSKSKSEVHVWRDHLSRLKKNAGTNSSSGL